MMLVYLDEFGHKGPYVARDHKIHNASPVFGLAGFLMPAENLRAFGSIFLKIKQQYCANDPKRGTKEFYEWEKKGTNFFTANSISRYPGVKDCMLRLLNEIKRQNGSLIYRGRQKFVGPQNEKKLNPEGLYTTIFADLIRSVDSYCEERGENFAIVVDQNPARIKLLSTATKTMYGNPPTRRLISPPFEVESHLNQQIQAADWIATVIGRISNHKIAPDEFSEFSPYFKYFDGRISALSVASELKLRAIKPSSKLASNGFERGCSNTAMREAFTRAGYIERF